MEAKRLHFSTFLKERERERDGRVVGDRVCVYTEHDSPVRFPRSRSCINARERPSILFAVAAERKGIS